MGEATAAQEPGHHKALDEWPATLSLQERNGAPEKLGLSG